MLRLILAAALAVMAMPASAAYLLIEASGPAGGLIYFPNGGTEVWTGDATATAVIPFYESSPACFAQMRCGVSGNTFNVSWQGSKSMTTMSLVFDGPIVGPLTSADGFLRGTIEGPAWVPGYGNLPVFGTGTITNIKIAVMDGDAPQDFSVSIQGSVPEPATWAMMIAGFGLLGGALRRHASAKPRLAQ